jgi:hypothetical protein
MSDFFSVQDMAWVAEDGSYGSGEVIHFEPTALDDEQWELLGELPDSQRLAYVEAVLNGDDLSAWEDGE